MGGGRPTGQKDSEFDYCAGKDNLVPRAFSSFKMAVGETPGQGC